MRREALKHVTHSAQVLGISEQDAVCLGGEWVRRHLPDRLCAGGPTLTATGEQWRVPVMLAYPFLLVGEVGEVFLAADSGEVLSHTSVSIMKANAKRLGMTHRAEISAASGQWSVVSGN
jgi:hypothetical protein